MYYSIVKDSSADFGVNFKIVQNRPTVCLFVTEEIQYHGGLRSRELGQAPILLCVPNS